jgi:uncharacterized protein YciW
MVRINKNELPRAKVKQLLKQLDHMISLSTPEKVSDLLQSLLGPEERLMLAKRLAVLVMIKEGYSHYRIAHALKLSPSTVQNIKDRQNANTLNKTTETLAQHAEIYNDLVEIIDSLLHVGGIMPHRTGLDRYRHLK